MSDAASLLVDIGNTNIKYSWFNPDSSVLSELLTCYTSLDALEEISKSANSIYICCVAADSELIKRLSQLGQPTANIVFLKARESELGIANSYPVVNNMGVDRWMCILACRALGSKNYLVFHAGTALTTDAVIGHAHIGGWISTGYTVSRRAISQQAAKVVDNSELLGTLQFGSDTPYCVANGALAQLIGVVSTAADLFAEQCEQFDIFIGGGDGKFLYDNLPNKLTLGCQYFDNLVLIGMAAVVSELNKNT
ncbi:type III pantothenate kinase [Agaribacter flavus]|uniref:Type III pantothenate kinase n=1 Tax=Agaribacter flavus TaxID=1902781 RepID=A0ABV7FSM9_9ALTE